MLVRMQSNRNAHSLLVDTLGEALTGTARPGQAKTVTICMSYCTTGDLVRNTELTSHQQLEEFGKGQKEREDASPHVLPTSQNPPRWNPSWLSDVHDTRKDPESE